MFNKIYTTDELVKILRDEQMACETAIGLLPELRRAYNQH